MKLDPAIRRETRRVACGIAIADILMFAVFFLLKKFNYTVVLGALLGSGAAVLNFFLLGITVQKAADKDDGQKKLVQSSYSLRMMMMCLTIILGAVLPVFHTVAVIVPFLLNTPVILLLQAFDRLKAKKDDPKEVG